MKAAPAARPLLTFGQCLKEILNKRKLSASALSRMMEQKSRNSAPYPRMGIAFGLGERIKLIERGGAARG